VRYGSDLEGVYEERWRVRSYKGLSLKDDTEERCEPRLLGVKTWFGDPEEPEDDVELSAYVAMGA